MVIASCGERLKAVEAGGAGSRFPTCTAALSCIAALPCAARVSLGACRANTFDGGAHCRGKKTSVRAVDLIFGGPGGSESGRRIDSAYEGSCRDSVRGDVPPPLCYGKADFRRTILKSYSAWGAKATHTWPPGSRQQCSISVGLGSEIASHRSCFDLPYRCVAATQVAAMSRPPPPPRRRRYQSMPVVDEVLWAVSLGSNTSVGFLV